MADTYKRPCFDSSVFIAGMNGEICRGIKRGVVFNHLMDQVRANRYRILMSALALAEVHKKRRFEALDYVYVDEFLEITEGPYVDIIQVDREVGLHAQRLCREYSSLGLLPADAIHLACALAGDCDVLLTWDSRLGKVKHPNIRIEAPMILESNLLTESEVATPDEIKEYGEQNKAKPQFILVSTGVLRCGGDAFVSQAPSKEEPADASSNGLKTEEIVAAKVPGAESEKTDGTPLSSRLTEVDAKVAVVSNAEPQNEKRASDMPAGQGGSLKSAESQETAPEN